MSDPATLLQAWLEDRLDAEQRAWLAAGCAAAENDPRAWSIAFATAARRLGHRRWQFTAQQLAAADAARPGWRPGDLSLSAAARLRLLLAVPDAHLPARLAEIFATADLAESVACYRGLPLYPDPEHYRTRAAEGVRSNVQDVFCAVAHHNPYPAEQFADGPWNQMVLKALFIGVALDPIQGLEQRANRDLARMLVDYARERRAAGRTISPELWRCVAPHADGEALDLLAWVLGEGSARERDAAALALHVCPHPDAEAILARDPQRRDAARDGALDWAAIAQDRTDP